MTIQYLTDLLAIAESAPAILRSFKQDPSKTAGGISAILVRHKEISKLATPSLTKEEWLAICDACNGTFMIPENAESDPARFISTELTDPLRGLGNKWGIDAEVLAKKLDEMDYVTQVAVHEVVQRFWETADNSSCHVEALKIAGANIKYEE